MSKSIRGFLPEVLLLIMIQDIKLLQWFSVGMGCDFTFDFPSPVVFRKAEQFHENLQTKHCIL